MSTSSNNPTLATQLSLAVRMTLHSPIHHASAVLVCGALVPSFERVALNCSKSRLLEKVTKLTVLQTDHEHTVMTKPVLPRYLPKETNVG